MSQPVPVSKLIVPVALIVFACAGLFTLGYFFGIQNPKLTYVTQTQPPLMMTQTIVSYSTQTETTVSQVTESIQITQSAYQGSYNYGGQYYGGQGQTVACSYPLSSPDWCAQVMGDYPAQTVSGMLVLSGSCYFLHTGYTNDYVLYNVPSNTASYLNQNVQAYGYSFPNWPQGQGFPLNAPFSYSTPQCNGTPLWMLPPYFQEF
jgi:hypothetical protein